MKKAWFPAIIFLAVIFTGWFLVVRFGKHLLKPNKQAPKVFSPIRPDDTFIQYWQMNGEPVMLLGGSNEDNLFQDSSYLKQLDLLKAAGGNYVRNTMSSRDEGNLWPFAMTKDSLYDLNKWNDTYWERFDTFLKNCAERDIVVQVELWATFDFYRDNWLKNPFNPKNNINYTAGRVHLPVEVNSHPVLTENSFFRSIPNSESNLRLLWFQQKYIDKLLSVSLKYPNVLYCMDNETSVTAEWGKFWSLYIKKLAREQGKEIYTTEMWDPWDLHHTAHRETSDHPEIYDFVDISQNNHNSGDEHWQNGIAVIERLKKNGMLRPLNNVKIYGNDGGRHQTTQNAIESFVRNVLFGAASARFHRPTSGQGINETAQHVIRSMRSYIEKCDFFHGQPIDSILLSKEKNEAWCRAIPGREYTVFFPDGGEIILSLPDNIGNVTIEWLDILNAQWREKSEKKVKNGELPLTAPDKKNQLAFIKIK